MYYVYVLESGKDKEWYVGSTSDLKRRIRDHHCGKSPSTKHRRPLRLIFYEAYPTLKDAKRREQYLKTAKGKTSLRTMLSHHLETSQS